MNIKMLYIEYHKILRRVATKQVVADGLAIMTKNFKKILFALVLSCY